MAPVRAPDRQVPVLRLIGDLYVRIKPGKGAKLKKRRQARHLTQAQLGFLCDRTSQAAISLLESEKLATCTKELAEMVCLRLDLDLEDYFEVHGGPSDPETPTAQVGTRRRPGRRGGKRAKPRPSSPEGVAA